MNNRNFQPATPRPVFSTGRQPTTAAMLSVIPGLGQFYNGQSVKGFLFMDVAVVNAALLTIVLFAEPMSRGLRTLLTGSHIKPNDGVLQAIASAHLGTPFSMVLLSLIALFIGFAVRDAYDSAKGQKLRPIYGDSALHLSEAASGAYLFHFAALCSCVILALCFLVPRPERQQITEIIFTDNAVKDVEPVHPKKFAAQPSSATKKTVTVKDPTPKSSTASAARQTTPQQQAQPQRQPQHQTQTTPQAAQPKVAPGKSEPAPAPRVVNPAPAAMRQPVPVRQPAPTPMPLNLPKPVLPNAAPAVVPTPTPSTAKPAATLPSPTLLAMAPKLPFGNLPAPVAISHANSGPSGNLPMPAAAGARSSSPSSIIGGPPAPMNLSNSSSSTSNNNPTPIAGGGTRSRRSSNSNDSGSDDTPAPKRIASATGPSSLATPSVGPATTAPSTGLRTNPSPALRDSHGKDTESGSGKSIEDVAPHINFGPYMAELQRRIKRNWQPPKDPNSRQVVLEFNVFKSGELGSVKIARSSGIYRNDQAAMDAVRAAAPFMPLPKGADDSVDIQFTFDYHVFGGHTSY